MHPAQQCFKAEQCRIRAPDIEQRLIDKRELFGLVDRVTQILVKLESAHGMVVERLFECCHTIAAELFGSVHRHVSGQHDIERADLVGHCDADAGRHFGGTAVDIERQFECAADALGECSNTGSVESKGHDNEFVTAEARDKMACPGRCQQAGGGLDQKRVAGDMPHRIVNRLETVEVDEQQTRIFFVVICRRRFRQPLFEAPTIGQTRKRIEIRKLGQGGAGMGACDVLAFDRTAQIGCQRQIDIGPG